MTNSNTPEINNNKCTFTNLDIIKLFDRVSSENKHINPIYIKITGSITCGYLLTQLIFLSKAYKHGSFYKTDAYMMEHYGFSEWELRSHRQKLIALGVITTEIKGIPAKLYYQINIDNLIRIIVAVNDMESPLPPKESNDNSGLIGGNINSEDPSALTPRRTRRQLRVDLGTIITTNNNNNNNHILLKKEGLKDDFDKFWELYPDKIGKKQAAPAFLKALQRGKASFDAIYVALMAQIKERGLAAQYGLFTREWPHPTTWLNNDRWEDAIRSEEQLKRESSAKARSKDQSRTAVALQAEKMYSDRASKFKNLNPMPLPALEKKADEDI